MQDPIELNGDGNPQPNIENVENSLNQENQENQENQVNQENINAIPQYPTLASVPQYSIPQYSVPQYTVPQYQEPEQNIINNYQPYQPPIYQPNNQEQIVQQPNLNTQNQVKNNVGGCPNSWELFSFFSWILLMSSKWDMFRRSAEITNEIYRPILYNRSFVQYISLIITILGFVVYLKNIVYKKNENLYQALYSQYSKFHCFAFIFYSALSFTGERQVMSLNTNNMSSVSDSFSFKAFSAFYMIFSILTLFSIIFVYFCTDMVCDWYIVMSIKKGIYSVIIAETVQHFFDSIFFARLASISDSDTADPSSLYKVGGVFFCILVFAIVGTLAILKKDIIMILINFLMYCGMIFNFYTKASVAGMGAGTPVVCIIVLVLQVVVMFIMIVKFKEQLIES